MASADRSGGEHGYFGSRSAAEAWVAQQQRHTARTAMSLSRDARTLGLLEMLSGETDGPYGIMLGPDDDLVDAVRVLPESVMVRDGVLRGLVRNWSRHLWAYRVTVSAGGREFVWPLSVQPGEIAPFEFSGWDGPFESAEIETETNAVMSPYADPSRAFGARFSSVGYFVGDSARQEPLQSLRRRYGQVSADVPSGQLSSGSLRWGGVHVEAPTSHPSLADDIDKLEVADLRGYGALLDRDGRVVDVGPAAVGRVYWTSGEENDVSADPTRRWEEVPHLPFGGLDIRDFELRFDVHAPWAVREFREPPPVEFMSYLQIWPENEDWYRIHIEGGFVLWVGAAHPEQDSG